jgi:hypothetical protein
VPPQAGPGVARRGHLEGVQPQFSARRHRRIRLQRAWPRRVSPGQARGTGRRGTRKLKVLLPDVRSTRTFFFGSHRPEEVCSCEDVPGDPCPKFMRRHVISLTKT